MRLPAKEHLKVVCADSSLKKEPETIPCPKASFSKGCVTLKRDGGLFLRRPRRSAPLTFITTMRSISPRARVSTRAAKEAARAGLSCRCAAIHLQQRSELRKRNKSASVLSAVCDDVEQRRKLAYHKRPPKAGFAPFSTVVFKYRNE